MIFAIGMKNRARDIFPRTTMAPTPRTDASARARGFTRFLLRCAFSVARTYTGVSHGTMEGSNCADSSKSWLARFDRASPGLAAGPTCAAPTPRRAVIMLPAPLELLRPRLGRESSAPAQLQSRADPPPEPNEALPH